MPHGLGHVQCMGCPLYETDPSCECMLRYMADDGNGYKVTIPSFMITRVDGDKFQASAAVGFPNPAQAVAQLRWDIVSPT